MNLIGGNPLLHPTSSFKWKDKLTSTLFELLKGSTAPGGDGFTVNWRRVFWNDLRELVPRALNEMYETNELSGICRKALIKLLRKGDKFFFFYIL